jgi:hypothetical protein
VRDDELAKLGPKAGFPRFCDEEAYHIVVPNGHGSAAGDSQACVKVPGREWKKKSARKR